MSRQALHSPPLSDEAGMITAQLQQLHKRLKQNPELAKLVPFAVQPRNQRDSDRFAKLLKYAGPDQETLSLLENDARRWHIDPSTFAMRSAPVHLSTSDPLVHLASRFLQLKHDDA